MKRISIANGAGFWGDSPAAPRQLLESADFDYLTLEYLAELTLSILAHQKQKNPAAGFVTEVPVVAELLAQQIQLGKSTKLITNGGGMNPAACAQGVAQKLTDHQLPDLRIGVASGDDFADRISELLDAGETLANMDTGEPFSLIQDRIASANVYLGAAGIVDALNQDASIVLTGRIADACLVTGPSIHELNWSMEDLDLIAQATVAGHLIECGAQATGGIYSDWTPDVSLGDIGYPIAELDAQGNSWITKPAKSGGVLNERTCAEQLIYEIGDPERYMTPDVIADFSHVQFQTEKDGRVQASGGRSNGKPDKLKASIAYYDGFMACGMIVIAGSRSVEKARAAGEAIFRKLELEGITFSETNIEILGAGDSACGMTRSTEPPWEVVLRVSARSNLRESTDRLIREIAPLVTSGPPGVTGYTGARSRSTPVLSFWPTLISREHLHPVVEVKSAKDWLAK